jgi:uncharacterized protein with PhoU and TrkA domain
MHAPRRGFRGFAPIGYTGATLFVARASRAIGARAFSRCPNEEVRSLEAVIQPESTLIGSSAQRARLQERYGVKLLAVGRSSQRITERLREVTLRAGDVLLVQAGEKGLSEFLSQASLLPLAERSRSW